jgi:hypothetical protein
LLTILMISTMDTEDRVVRCPQSRVEASHQAADVPVSDAGEGKVDDGR